MQQSWHANLNCLASDCSTTHVLLVVETEWWLGSPALQAVSWAVLSPGSRERQTLGHPPPLSVTTDHLSLSFLI